MRQHGRAQLNHFSQKKTQTHYKTLFLALPLFILLNPHHYRRPPPHTRRTKKEPTSTSSHKWGKAAPSATA